jgi:hypothetical protein
MAKLKKILAIDTLPITWFFGFFLEEISTVKKKGLVQQGVKKRVDFFFLLMEPAIEKVCIQKFPEKTAV